MDLLTHLLTGWLLVRALPERWRGGDGRLRVAGLWLPTAALLAAALPDAAELVVGPDRSADLVHWLETERGWSHGLIGAALAAGALWLLLLPSARGDRRAGRWAAGWSPGRAAAIVFGGAGLHLAWDALTPLGLRPLFPLSGVWIRGDLVLPGDPWIHLVLLAGVGLTLWREELGQWFAWALLTAFALWFGTWDGLIGLLEGRPPYTMVVPLLVAGVWTIGLAHVLALRRWRRWPRAPWVAAGLIGFLLGSSVAFNVAAERTAVAALHDELKRTFRFHVAPADERSTLTETRPDADFRPRALASRPDGAFPWERLVLAEYRPPTPMRYSRGMWDRQGRLGLSTYLAVSEIAPRRPDWSFAPRLGGGGQYSTAEDPIRRAGLDGDPRVRAWRGWCRFPNATMTDFHDRLLLQDWPFLPDHPFGPQPVFRIELPPSVTAERRSDEASAAGESRPAANP